MSDPKNGLPAADWYPDPSDPTSERWWGGLEWTNHTRPVDVAPPPVATPQFALATAAPAPQFALQAAAAAPVAAPSFAAQLAAAAPSLFESQPVSAAPTQAFPAQPVSAAQPAPLVFSPSQFSSAEEASEVASWVGGLSASTGSPWETTRAPAASFFGGGESAQPTSFFGTGEPAQTTTAPIAAPLRSRSSRTRREEQGAGASRAGRAQPDPSAETAKSLETLRTARPAKPAKAARPVNPRPAASTSHRNTPAIVGFILSLLGFGLISLIISARGARKASNLYHVGEAPTGRVLARWGIALSIIEMVVGLLAGGLFAYLYFFGGGLAALEQFSAGAGGTSTENTILADTTVAKVVPTSETISAGMADSVPLFYGVDAQSVDCPADALPAAGTVVTCDIVLLDGRALSGVQTFTDHGFSTEYFAK